MKLKYLFLTLILLMIGISTVDAKSIEYNLTIDKDLYFHEANVYRVNESELDTSGNYDFMTSVVKDKIYFDNDNGVPYTKTKKKANGEYIVTLKNDYSPIFLTGSRILNECFSEFDFKDNEKSLSIKTTSPFYCYSRADSIVININLPPKFSFCLQVLSKVLMCLRILNELQQVIHMLDARRLYRIFLIILLNI